GVVRIDNPGAEHPTFTAYTTAQGLSSDSAAVIADDRFGSIYIGTGRGLDRLDPATGRLTHFTTADGLAPGPIATAFRAADGTMWFGTTKGLSRYVPSTESHREPPRIVVTSMNVAGARQSISALGESSVALAPLAADQNNL